MNGSLYCFFPAWNTCRWSPSQPNSTWIASCRSPRVAVTGRRTRRQISGREPGSETFSSATWSMLRGAPEAANSATACASPAASGWPVARTFARRVSRSVPGMLSQTRVSASSGPLSCSAAAAASTASQSQSASLGSGPWSQAASTARACGPTRGAAVMSRQAGSASVAQPLHHPDGHAAQQRRHPLGGGEDLPCRFGGLAFGQPSPRHMVPLFLVAEPGGLGDHLGGRQARVRQAGQAAARCPAAQRPSGVIIGLPGSPVTAPNSASSATSPASGVPVSRS